MNLDASSPGHTRSTLKGNASVLNMTPMAFGRVRESGKATYIYKCHFGLFEAVAPLYSFRHTHRLSDDGTDPGSGTGGR